MTNEIISDKAGLRRVDFYLFAAIAFAAFLIGSSIVGNSIESGLRNANTNDASEANRYIIRSQYANGIEVFDTATGRTCSVPYANMNGDQPACSNAPD